MRQIKLLPIASGSGVGDEVKSKREVNYPLFAAGLLIGVVAALLGFALAKYAGSLAVDSALTERMELARKEIEQLPPGQSWDAWDSMTTAGLPEWKEAPAVKYSKQSVYLAYISTGLYFVSAVGFLMLAVSFMGLIRKSRSGPG